MQTVLGILAIILFFSCSKVETLMKTSASGSKSDEAGYLELSEAIARFSEGDNLDPDRIAFIEDSWRWNFGAAGIPDQLAKKVVASAIESPAFIMELLEIMNNDPYTYFLVDKQHPLPEGYAPNDLVNLQNGAYRISRDGLQLRKIAVEALEEMTAAALAEGINLSVGSAYRSAEYQAEVYAREVRMYGQEIADRESAQSGKSQHQLGLVVDFFPIDDTFANTPAYKWLMQNAIRFGWSLSYPDGYEEVTGYRFESWHYRYVGKDLALFIENYFDGIQQYALQFINTWQQESSNW